MPARSRSAEAGKAPIPSGLPLPLQLTWLFSPLKCFPVHFAISFYPSVGRDRPCPERAAGAEDRRTAVLWHPAAFGHVGNIVPVAETVLPLPPVFENGFSRIYSLTQVTLSTFSAQVLTLIITLQY